MPSKALLISCRVCGTYFNACTTLKKTPLFIYLVLIRTMYVAADTKQGGFLSPSRRLIIFLGVFVSEGRDVSEWEKRSGSWANAI